MASSTLGPFTSKSIIKYYEGDEEGVLEAKKEICRLTSVIEEEAKEHNGKATLKEFDSQLPVPFDLKIFWLEHEFEFRGYKLDHTTQWASVGNDITNLQAQQVCNISLIKRQ